MLDLPLVVVDLRCKRVIFSHRNESYIGGHSNEWISKPLVSLGHLICLPGCITNSGVAGMKSMNLNLSLSLSLSLSRSLSLSLSLTHTHTHFSSLTSHGNHQGTSSQTQTKDPLLSGSWEQWTHQCSWRNLWRKSPASLEYFWCVHSTEKNTTIK